MYSKFCLRTDRILDEQKSCQFCYDRVADRYLLP
jgi:hypothetical protein